MHSMLMHVYISYLYIYRYMYIDIDYVYVCVCVCTIVRMYKQVICNWTNSPGLPGLRPGYDMSLNRRIFLG